MKKNQYTNGELLRYVFAIVLICSAITFALFFVLLQASEPTFAVLAILCFIIGFLILPKKKKEE